MLTLLLLQRFFRSLRFACEESFSFFIAVACCYILWKKLGFAFKLMARFVGFRLFFSYYLDGLSIFHIFNFDSVKYPSDLQHDILSLLLVKERYKLLYLTVKFDACHSMLLTIFINTSW